MTYRNSSAWTGRAPRTLESASGFAHRSSVAVIEPMRTTEPVRRRVQDRALQAVCAVALVVVVSVLAVERQPQQSQTVAVADLERQPHPSTTQPARKRHASTQQEQQ